MTNLPKWKGASKVYSTAYRFLAIASMSGEVTTKKNRKGEIVKCYPSEHMTTLIEALNKGDEETIKGLLLHWRSLGY